MKRVIGFETTCDDTGVAIVDSNGTVLCNEVESQVKRHLWNGGIIPMVAKELHVDAIDNVAIRAFKNSKLTSFPKEIEAVAVANRPGLYQSIQVGLNYARTLAKKHSKPLIPIHHMQAHSLMPLLEHRQIRFPFITLLISGGHCILAVAKRFNDFHILGQTTDDAPGDILDKFSRRFRLKNLGQPFDRISGGAAVEILARDGDRFKYFNRQSVIPAFKHKSCDFSFSGYRGSYEPLTQMIDELWLSGDRKKLIAELSDICASLQRVILIQLVKRIHRALTYFRMHWRYKNEDAFSTPTSKEHLGFGLHDINFQDGTDSIDLVISGGVASNKYLVENLEHICMGGSDMNMKVFSPSAGLSNDNGLMIAWNGLLHLRNHSLNPQSSILLNNPDQMEELDAMPESLMGLDLRDQIKFTSFDLNPLKHPELKLT